LFRRRLEYPRTCCDSRHDNHDSHNHRNHDDVTTDDVNNYNGDNGDNTNRADDYGNNRIIYVRPNSCSAAPTPSAT